MEKSPFKLSANPLELVRALPTQLVPIDKIKRNPDKARDEIFLAKYRAFLKGRTPVHETRLTLSKIRRGFWKKEAQGWVLDGDEINRADLDYVIEIIRLGARPVLYVYETPHPQDEFRFICTDDTAIHAAYEQLGIVKVPVSVMARPKDLEESCLSVRHFPRGRRESIALLDGMVPVETRFVPSILGEKKPEITQSFSLLLAALSNAKQLVRDFHLPGSTKLHYHHTLYSVLLRAEDCVESMKLLVGSGKTLTAAGLLRSLHELALVFYVDWLAPGQTYRYLQMASVMNEKTWDECCSAWYKEDVAAGASPLEAKNIKDAHMRSFRLGSVVGDKARIFPLGEEFQRDIYSFLSDVIHHDFSMTARYAFTLDHGDDAIYHDDALDTIIHLSDILVGAIVSRVRDDVGSFQQSSSV